MKQKFREWLTEHFGFVPVEDYEVRGRVLAGMSSHALALEQTIKRKNRIIDQLTNHVEASL